MATQCCGQQTYGRAEQPKHDKRIQLIDDIKVLIENIDNEERGRSKGTHGRAAGGGAPGSVRDPDLERQCREYRKLRGCSPPVITSIGAHEFRPTSDFTKKQYENTSQVTYVDATRTAGTSADLDPMPPAPWELPRTPSQELRAGTLYQSCECGRRNGLQHDCPRWECGGRPECVAVNPGPCCAPFKARKPVRGDRRVKPQARQGADVTGQRPGGQHQGQSTGAPVQPGLVVPVFVRVGGQQQDGPRVGPVTAKGPGVTCECSPAGGQSPIGRAQELARAYLCDVQGGQRSNPDFEKHHQQNQARPYLCQPQGHSSKEGAEKITEMPGPHGWPAGGGGSLQNAHRAYLLEQQGGQQPNQMPRGNPITIKGPGVTCLCRPVGGQEPTQAPYQNPRQPQFGGPGAPQTPQGPITLQGPGVTCLCRPAGGQAPPQAPYQNPRQPQFGGPGAPQTPQGPITLQGPGVTCLCRPAGSSHARAQPHPQPQVGGGGYVDLYEMVVIGQPNPGQ